VTGPRQSGKTTLCKMAFPEYEYVNLERATTRALVEQDIEGFLLQYPNGLIIDEAQNLPELFSVLQVVVDENKSLRYVLSGSSDFLLMQNISQSLAGRVAVMRLLPLSLSELGADTSEDVNEQMWRGFYPAVWGDKKDPHTVYDSYVATYIQKDVRQIVNIKDLTLFRRFLTLVATRVGTEFVASSIAAELSVDYKTIQSWMSILETSYTAFLLHPFYRNIGKRLTKTPKVYFYDVGLVCYLLGIETAQQLAHHPLRGAIFENMVVCDMLKERYNKGLDKNIMFYRDKVREVDILQEEAGRLHAYEVKVAERFHSDFIKSLDYLKALLKDDLLSMNIVYTGENKSVGSIHLKNYKDIK
ncbi:MAG: ATP-binding protein, partial [Paludibacteraceae bacterium]|nr:ATP-binding protein [Paludibacteraceae bacterium]